MNNSMKRVALVTGGAQGIGRGVCQRLVADGWRVVALDIDPQALDEPKQELSDQIAIFCADVAAMVSYILSPQAEFVTGQNFIIDGGMTRKMIYAE